MNKKTKYLLLAATMACGFQIFSASASTSEYDKNINGTAYHGLVYQCKGEDPRSLMHTYEHVTYFDALTNYAHDTSFDFTQLKDQSNYNWHFNCKRV